eukprot:SAG31_NODE_872_length_11329_cov_3.968655_1_plen_98_part_10
MYPFHMLRDDIADLGKDISFLAEAAEAAPKDIEGDCLGIRARELHNCCKPKFDTLMKAQADAEHKLTDLCKLFAEQEQPKFVHYDQVFSKLVRFVNVL